MGSLHNGGIPAPARGHHPVPGGNLAAEHTSAVQKGVAQDTVSYTSEIDKTIIIKWSIVGGLFLLLLLFVVIGHIHARARLRKGLPLLFYHKYLIASPKARSTKATLFDSNIESQDAPEYYAPPPPAYDSNQAPPPTYQPSKEALKATHLEIPAPLSSDPEQPDVPSKRSILSKIKGLGRGSK